MITVDNIRARAHNPRMDTPTRNEERAMQVIGFHPVSDTERVQIIRTASGDYQIRLMVDGQQVGNTRGAYGPGLVGRTNAQVAAHSWAKGMRFDRQRVAR